MSEWIDIEAAAALLGVDVDDPRLVSSTAAVEAAVERRRTDIDYDDVPADVQEGALAWVALLYQQRSAPTGFAGYDAETALADAGSRRREIMRLLGFRRPVVG